MIDRLWNDAIEITEKRHFSLNYPNIYAQYIRLTMYHHKKVGLKDRFEHFFHKESSINVSRCTKYGEGFDISFDDDMRIIDNLVKQVKENFDNDYDWQTRRKLISLIQEAMLEVQNIESLKKYGTLIEEKSSESDVFVDEEKNVVYKSRDIYAHDALKPHNPWECFYEQIVHNMLFPNTFLKYIGICQRNGYPSMVYQQPYFRDMRGADDSEIEEYLKKLGLSVENKYCYGDDYLYVTDVVGKNVLADDKGNLYFIDTNVYFKKPVKEVIAHLKNKLCINLNS